MVVAGLDAEALGLLVPSTLILVVLELEFVAVLSAVLPLPLVEPLLAVLPLGDVVMLPEAVVPLAPVDGAVAVLAELVPRCRVVVSPDVVCAYAPATNKDAINVASSLLMSVPFQLE
jgi:hypothetical protein